MSIRNYGSLFKQVEFDELTKKIVYQDGTTYRCSNGISPEQFGMISENFLTSFMMMASATMADFLISQQSIDGILLIITAKVFECR